MTADKVKGEGTPDKPWILATPSGGSEFSAFRNESLHPPALVVQAGKIELRYHLRCWTISTPCSRSTAMLLGSADEQKPAQEGSVEAWARSPENPVGGWYGLKKGFRGRCGNYPTGDGGVGPGRGGAPGQEQPHAGRVTGLCSFLAIRPGV